MLLYVITPFFLHLFSSSRGMDKPSVCIVVTAYYGRVVGNLGTHYFCFSYKVCKLFWNTYIFMQTYNFFFLLNLRKHIYTLTYIFWWNIYQNICIYILYVFKYICMVRPPFLEVGSFSLLWIVQCDMHVGISHNLGGELRLPSYTCGSRYEVQS